MPLSIEGIVLGFCSIANNSIYKTWLALDHASATVEEAFQKHSEMNSHDLPNFIIEAHQILWRALAQHIQTQLGSIVLELDGQWLRESLKESLFGQYIAQED